MRVVWALDRWFDGRCYSSLVQRLALFDLDDTLVDRRRAFLTWAEEFASAHGLDEKWTTWLIFADAHHSGPMDQFFAMVREELDLGESADALWAQYRRRMPELISCNAEDLQALVELRTAGWRIGIVTNGMTDNQHSKIRNSGLAALVDAWCISDEVGVRKPDPRIFGLAAQRCGVSVEGGGWMTGDSLPMDITGGHRAGFRTIWLAEPRLARLAAEKGPGFFVDQAPDVIAGSVAQAVMTILAAQ